MNNEKFLKAVDTLKLYRRAELIDEKGEKLVSQLYVDPLPGEHVLRTVLKPNTTFLVGRKGTGKSTIFQRAQDVLSSNPQVIWAYIDIKTLYESSTSEIVGTTKFDAHIALSPEAIERLAIFKSFVIELIQEIKHQIRDRITSSVWKKLKERFTGSVSELFENLDEFVEELKTDQYLDVTGQVQASKQNESTGKAQAKTTFDVSASLAESPSFQAKMLADVLIELERKRSQNYSQVFVRVFNIRRLITRLREILATLDVQYLYVFIDDFSELPRGDMEQVVDTILTPFNNWSEEFIKLKIAVYPGRLYPGAIDLSKVDEVYLDIYRAYGRNDVADMEERAIDFTRRLVTTRLQHFCKKETSEYFEIDSNDFWRTLFYACVGNPRILGYLLYFGYETSILYGRRIGIRTIQSASRRYYEEKISHYFWLNKFLHETFEERSSIYSLKELLEQLIERAKSLRNYRESKIMQELHGRPPTSHFHIKEEYDSVLSSLELNFFLTKYYEMKDRDGRDVSVYALNYGLCQQEAITFGRPREKREHRVYFIERFFDFTPIIVSYIKINQEIVCDNCAKRYGQEMLSAIQKFGMLCPECRIGTCRVVNLSRKYERLIRSVADENLLPGTELGILQALHDERRQMFAKEIARELDCSYQLIGKRGRNLAERGLVSREKNDGGRRVFQLSQAAERVYFTREPENDI